MKQGFTLVELLAVITILAIILLITIPVVISSIKNSKEKSLISSASGYVDSLKIAFSNKELEEKNLYCPSKCEVILNGNVKCDNEEIKIDFRGKKPTSGTLYFEDCNIMSDSNLVFNTGDLKYNGSNWKIISKTPTEPINPIAPEDTTDIACFDYIDNYSFDINTDNCMSKFNNEYFCSGDGKDSLINYAYGMGYKINDLERLNIISNKKALNTLSIVGYKCGGSIDSIANINTGEYSSGSEMNVKIPSSINGKDVTKIGFGSFSALNIENSQPNETIINSVVIPSTVVKIEDYAFIYNVGLTNVTIGNNVTSIGGWAFYFNKLTNVTIPNSVISIGDEAFRNNQLTSVIIPNSVTSIGYGVFADNNLTSVIIPNGITNIKSSTFAFNKLTNVTISDSVTSIGQQAFFGNELSSIIIPKNVTSIGRLAFSNNKLTSVTIPSNVTSIDYYAFNQNELISVVIKGKNSLSDFSLYGNSIWGWASGYSDNNIIWNG